jgi:hypothetical protein
VVAYAGARAGILQPFGANVGWDYQVSAWFHLKGEGKCRLGLDPSGGVDPTSSEVTWSEVSPLGCWMLLADRVTAKKRAVTVFLEVSEAAGTGTAWFDGASIVVTPCALKAEPSLPPSEEEKCVNWKDEKPSHKGKEFAEEGFTFKAPSSLQVVTWSEPQGEGKLLIPTSGLEVVLPFEAGLVVAHVVQNGGRFVVMEALDANGKAVGQASTAGARGKVEALGVSGEGILSLQFTAGGEDLLIDLCAYRAQPAGAVTGTPAREVEIPFTAPPAKDEALGPQPAGPANVSQKASGDCGCGSG